MSNTGPASAETAATSGMPLRNLVLEGGGGKGFAYLGLVRALEGFPPPGQPGKAGSSGHNYLASIDRFAGSSAGAITSMFLSMKYGSEDVKRIMTTEADSFKRFMSPSNPEAESGDLAPLSTDERRQTPVPQIEAALVVVKAIALAKGHPEIHPRYLFLNLIKDWGLFGGDRKLQQFVRPKTGASLRMRHADQAPPGEPQLDGDAPLVWLKQQVAVGLQRFVKKGEVISKLTDPYGYSFADLSRLTGKGLFVTGTNLTSGKTIVFSTEMTPSFPVAVAVRISMGIPVAFSPIVLRPEFLSMRGLGRELAGHYVDGGLWNNTPFQILDKDSAAGLLIARLDRNEPKEIVTLGGYLWKLLAGYLAAGESQINFADGSNVIELDTGELDTLAFSPDKQVSDPVVRDAYWTTIKWLASREGTVAKEPASAATRSGR